MDKIALVFSGQGAQGAGMGEALYNTSARAKEVFDRAFKLNPDIFNICFKGEGLDKTLNAQPALYVCGLASAAAVEEVGINPDMCAGFSLGEIPALSYAGAFDFEKGFEIVSLRAKLMQECADLKGGGMAAVLGMDGAELHMQLKAFNNLYAVNYNCSGQTVIAGDKDELDSFILKLKELKKRAVKLNVAGAFHSPFMQDAADKMAKAIEGFNFSACKKAMYSNTTAEVYTDPKKYIPLQIKSAVNWSRQIENMHRDGAETFIEVGAGKVLCNLIKKILPEAKVFSTDGGLEEIKELLK